MGRSNWSAFDEERAHKRAAEEAAEAVEAVRQRELARPRRHTLALRMLAAWEAEGGDVIVLDPNNRQALRDIVDATGATGEAWADAIRWEDHDVIASVWQQAVSQRQLELGEAEREARRRRDGQLAQAALAREARSVKAAK